MWPNSINRLALTSNGVKEERKKRPLLKNPILDHHTVKEKKKKRKRNSWSKDELPNLDHGFKGVIRETSQTGGTICVGQPAQLRQTFFLVLLPYYSPGVPTHIVDASVELPDGTVLHRASYGGAIQVRYSSEVTCKVLGEANVTLFHLWRNCQNTDLVLVPPPSLVPRLCWVSDNNNNSNNNNNTRGFALSIHGAGMGGGGSGVWRVGGWLLQLAIVIIIIILL